MTITKVTKFEHRVARVGWFVDRPTRVYEVDGNHLGAGGALWEEYLTQAEDQGWQLNGTITHVSGGETVGFTATFQRPTEETAVYAPALPGSSEKTVPRTQQASTKVKTIPRQTEQK